MDITIAAKLKPFTDVPGTSCLIPGTSLRATVYPTRISLDDLSGALPVAVGVITIPLKAPSRPTIQLDLEKGALKVWGYAEWGYYRYHLSAFEGVPLALVAERGDLCFQAEGCTLNEEGAGRWSIAISTKYQSIALRPHLERLSFGYHRKQEWPMVLRRHEMGEVFPYWFQLAQWCPPQQPASPEGTATLLSKCCEAITARDRTALLRPFENLLAAGFEGMLSPTLEDRLYQGYDLNSLQIDTALNPLSMLVEGALLMRSLVLQRYDDEIQILPTLPVEFHAGRALHLRVKDKGLVDIEWTKKQIRRVVFNPTVSGELRLTFPKQITSFRLRETERDSGRRVARDERISVTDGQQIWLDRFQK